MMTNIYKEAIISLKRSERKEQAKLFDELRNTFQNHSSALLGQATTGVGKTFATSCAAIQFIHDNTAEAPCVVIAAPTIALCREYIAEMSLLGADCGLLMSFRNYFCKQRLNGVRLEYIGNNNATDLIDNMINWTGTIDQYITEYSELPLQLTQNQVCQTTNTVDEKFKIERESVIKKNIIITTHAMIASDIMRSGKILNMSQRKTVAIIDEADAFVDYLQDFQSMHFNIKREFSGVRCLMTKKFNDALDNTILELSSTAKVGISFSKEAKDKAIYHLKSLLNSMNGQVAKKISSEDKGFINDFINYIKLTIKDIEYSDQVSVALTKIKKEPTIAIYSPYFSRVFGAYASDNLFGVALISGTLSVDSDVNKGTLWVQKELKLDLLNVTIGEFCPTKFGNLNLTISRLDPPSYSLESDDDRPILSQRWLHDVAQEIEKTKGKTLVVTSSFKEAEMLASLLSNNALIHRSGEKLNPVKKKFIENDDIRILLSPSAHTGINFTNNQGRSILNSVVITRLGFKPQNDVLNNIAECSDFPASKIANLKKRDYSNSVNRVIRRSIQILGRGIRNKDDSIDVYILDSRFPLYDSLDSKYAKLRSIVPARFSREYRDANIIRPASFSSTEEDIDLSLIY